MHAFLVADLDDLVDEAGLEDVGDEAGADALQGVGAWFAAGEDVAGFGFDGDHADGGVAGFEHLADAGEGSAGADAADDGVHVAVGVVPDFLGGGFAVDGGVGLVAELVGADGVGG